MTRYVLGTVLVLATACQNAGQSEIDSDASQSKNNNEAEEPSAAQRPDIARDTPESFTAILRQKKLLACADSSVHADKFNTSGLWTRLLPKIGLELGCGDLDTGLRSPYFLKTIEGIESGVVVDEGLRRLFEVELKSCEGEKYVLRFTKDYLLTDEDVCGYEVFLKSSTGVVEGFAINSGADSIEEVPEILAKDKLGFKQDRFDETVRSGSGCFQCHVNVSYDFAMPGAAEFWDDSITPSVIPTPPAMP